MEGAWLPRQLHHLASPFFLQVFMPHHTGLCVAVHMRLLQAAANCLLMLMLPLPSSAAAPGIPSHA
jgi:hypothetical protein